MKNVSPFKVNLHELPRRAGERREYHLSFPAPEAIGTPLLAIPKDFEINIEFSAEAVDDGVLIRGRVQSGASGECSRCLDPINEEIDQDFQELYFYESRKPEDDEDDHFVLDGDIVDLEIAIRDAVVLTMPINPLCTEDCPGLCTECGQKWDDLPEGHTHEQVDPRWKGLAGWKGD